MSKHPEPLLQPFNHMWTVDITSQGARSIWGTKPMLGIGLGACDRMSLETQDGEGRDSNLGVLPAQPVNAAQAHCDGDIRVLCPPLGVHHDLRKAVVFERSGSPKPQSLSQKHSQTCQKSRAPNP